MPVFSIASAMLCGRPRKVGGNLALSCYDGVWDAVDELPLHLRHYFSDELGNPEPIYGGFLQVTGAEVISLLAGAGMYLCLRSVPGEALAFFDASPGSYEELETVRVGYDVAVLNGWRSASSSGVFPVDPFTGAAMNDCPPGLLNKNLLFDDLEVCNEWVATNNREVKTYGRWWPVEVLVDRDSARRLALL